MATATREDVARPNPVRPFSIGPTDFELENLLPAGGVIDPEVLVNFNGVFNIDVHSATDKILPSGRLENFRKFLKTLRKMSLAPLYTSLE